MAIFGGSKGDFIGISRDGLETLKAEIDKYIEEARTVIFHFNEYATRTETFKGDNVIEAIGVYLIEAKQGLIDYVKKLEIEKDRAQRALDEWEAGESTVAGTVTSNADTIRNDAAGFTLE